jgi:hypothetical protein
MSNNTYRKNDRFHRILVAVLISNQNDRGKMHRALHFGLWKAMDSEVTVTILLLLN